MIALVLDQNVLYAGIGVIVAVVVVFAVIRGRSVSVGVGKAHLDVGEAKGPNQGQQGAAGQNVNVANNSKISGSNFNVHVGDTVTSPTPGAGEESPKK